MIPFPFNENRFSFFVADHLLVGQLCTNPKSDRSLLSCLKVTQCSMSEIREAPLYNSCSLPIQVMTTGPLPAPSKCKSGWFEMPRVMKVSGYGYGLWCGFKWGPHHATSHVEKACSQFRIHIEAVIEAEGSYMSALQHNQVSWIEFFNKSFKIKL